MLEATKMRRKSYTREFKLDVVAFYRNDNLYHNSNSVSVFSVSWFFICNRTPDLLEYTVATNNTP